MLKRVVVGVDGSDTSTKVIDWCLAACSDTSTEVVVVGCHTVRSELGTDGNEALRSEVRADVEAACGRLTATGIACLPLVADGDARVALVETAQERSADLLVVGSRGRSEITDLVLGSVATYLTHHAPIPVVVVR